LFFIGLFTVTTLAVSVAWYVMPSVLHHQLIRNLTSADMEERQRALNYVINRAAERPQVLHDAIETMQAGDHGTFIQIASALDHAGLWRYPTIPAEPWLRWIELLGRDDNSDARIQAAQQLVDMDEIHRDPRVIEMIKRWLHESDGEVRLNALIAAAEIAGRMDQPNVYATLVLDTTADTNLAIAREACLLARVLNIPAPRCVYPDITPAAATDSDALRTADLGNAFESIYPFVRDRACVFALEHNTPEQNTALIGHLLRSFSDNDKRSGAILAGLTGLQTKLLRNKMEDEDIWEVKQIHQLGLWMQGQMPELDAQVPLMLATPQLPASTIYLALLHGRRNIGLDLVLTPRVDELALSPASLNLPEEESPDRVSLSRLLVRYRWWDVLRHYMPDRAPGLVLEADEQTIQYQIDLIRNWWLVHRRKQAAP